MFGLDCDIVTNRDILFKMVLFGIRPLIYLPSDLSIIYDKNIARHIILRSISFQEYVFSGFNMKETNIEAGKIIDERRKELSRLMLEARDVQPFDLWASRIGQGRESKFWDSTNHFIYLAEALLESDPDLFSDYVKWLEQLFIGFGFPSGALPSMLEYTKKLLRDILPSEMRTIADSYVDHASSGLGPVSADYKSHICLDGPLAELASGYLEALLDGDRSSAGKLILEAVESGVSVKDIYLDVFQTCQYEIGRLWHLNKVSVGQEHYCSAATQLIMSQLYPHIFSGEKIGKTFIGACVGGELHEIGVRMVADFFEMEGWDTYYLGANAPAVSVVEAITKYNADVVGLSVAMSYHRSAARNLISAIRKDCKDHKVRILVGGYALNQGPDLWKEMGADGFARDAKHAIVVANGMVSGSAA